VVTARKEQLAGLLIDGWLASPSTRVRIEYEADDPAIAAFRAAIAAFDAASPGDEDRAELIRTIATRLRPAIQEATSFMVARSATLKEAARRRAVVAKIAASKASRKAARAAVKGD